MENINQWFITKRILMQPTTKKPDGGGILTSLYFNIGEDQLGEHNLLMRNEQAVSMRDWLLRQFPLESFPVKA